MRKFTKLFILLLMVTLSPIFASSIENNNVIDEINEANDIQNNQNNEQSNIQSDIHDEQNDIPTPPSNNTLLVEFIKNNDENDTDTHYYPKGEVIDFIVDEKPQREEQDKPLETNINTELNDGNNQTINNLETNDKYDFFVDGFFGPAGRIARKNTFTVGGHASVDFHFLKEFSLGIYLHGEYFFSPLGSTSGLLVGLETELETGININFPIFQRGNFIMKLGCDIGYYMQWIQYESTISTNTHLGYNGMMLRPTFQIQFTHLWGMPIGIGLYYQITTVIPYKDYDGFGLYVML